MNRNDGGRIDPDVAARLDAEAARSDRAFKVVVNEASRRGLGLSFQAERRQTYTVTPVKLRFRPGHHTDKLKELAHLAALAVEYQAELHSTDTDFARFSGLRWRNPLEKKGRKPF